MISIVIPTLQSEKYIADCLVSLMPAVMNGLVKEVIVSDGGSTDLTAKICEEMGAVFLSSEAGRGKQLMAGAKMASSSWLLFLHVDSLLQPGWEEEVAVFIYKADQKRLEQAAFFRFSLNDKGLMPFIIEKGVGVRSQLLALPYGDQGLLVSRLLYDKTGGYLPVPLMEDVGLVRRIGRQRLTGLSSTIKTSACRYRQDGYFRRIGRNFLCIMLYFYGVSPEKIMHIYKGKQKGQGKNEEA